MMTEDKLIETIKKLCQASPKAVTLQSRLREDLMLSSLKMMMLIAELEASLGKDIPADRFRGIGTVGELLACLQEVERDA